MKTKQLKQAFGNMAQVCHVWAQQVQDYGYAGRIYFLSDTIYSYGPHYKAARIFTRKGKRFALMNSYRYSMQTGMHLNAIADSLRGLMPCFHVPDVTSPAEAVKYLDKKAIEEVERQLARKKITEVTFINYGLRSIKDAYTEANELRAILGLKPKQPKQADLDKVKAHLKARLARYKELNTPEMIEKRKVEAEKRAEKKRQFEALEDAEKARLWIDGGSNHCPYTENEYLRIIRDVVQTSRGAEVPLAEATMLYKAIVSRKDVVGANIGHFTVNKVEKLPHGDRLIHVGCHRILLSEASRVLGSSNKNVPNLKLVS